MKNNNLFHNLKQWSLKVSVGSIIFMSVMLLGGSIITLALPPSSLDDVKSNRANNQLIAENRDYLVDQVKSGWKKNGNNIYYNSGNVGIGVIPSSAYRLQVNGTGYFSGNVGIGGAPSSSYKTLIYNNTSNYGLYVNNQTGTYGLYVTGTGRNYLAGNLGIGTTPSASYKTYINNTSSDRGLYVNNQTGNYGLYVTGTGRNYLAGNLGIGTTSSTAYKLNVSGSGNFSGPLYAPTPTSSSTAKQVTTKEYVDNKISALPSSIWTKNGNNIYYNNGNVGIGTNSPSTKLHVAGNIIANDPTTSNHVATKGYVDNKVKITIYRPKTMLGSQNRFSVGSHTYCAISYVYLTKNLYNDYFQCVVRPNGTTQNYNGGSEDQDTTVSFTSNKTTRYAYFYETDESGDCGVICLDIG